MIDDEVLGWIRDAVKHADSWSAVSRALAARSPGRPDPRLRPFVNAFAFALLDRSGESRGRVGGPFGAAMSGEGWQFPPTLKDIAQEDIDAWREAFEAMEHPVARSRLGDLLWVRKAQPRPHLAAGAAVDALLVVALDAPWHLMERVRCLARALELAREINDPERQGAAVEQMLACVANDLRSDHGGPGVSLGLLGPLVGLPDGSRPDGLDDLLRQVDARYGEVPFIVDSVTELRSKLLDPDHRDELYRHQVERWRTHAQQGDTLLRVHALERALEIARTHGLGAETDELRHELGSIRPEDLGLKVISAEIKIPPEEVERFLARFDDAPTWREALQLLAAHGPPGGAPDKLADELDEVMAQFPLQFLFTKVLVGPDNATAIFRATGQEAHKRLAIAEERSRQARVWSIFYAAALDRIGARADRPDRVTLIAFFSTDFIEDEIAERIARAFELFWDNQPDESAHVLAPRLERVVREVARQLGVPIVREPRPDREVGGVEMLGGTFRALQNAFADPGWHAYLLNVLADPLGLNLRNSIAHGLHGTVGRLDSALLLHIALILAGMRLIPLQHPPEPPPGAVPTG